jgi:predicted aspartyl protease
MRDRYRWFSFLLSFVLAGQAMAGGYQESGLPQAAVRRAMEGTVGFDLYQGYLIVARGSAGPLKGLNFLLDTGASPTVLDPRIARKLHLEEFPESIRVLDGSVRAERAILPSLNFGPIQRENIPVLIEDLSFLERALPVRVDGMIGLDVLGQSAFLIDYVSHEIHFGSYSPLPISMPLRMAEGLAIVDSEVNHAPARLLVDTGASSLILFETRAPGSVSELKISAVKRSSNLIGEFERKQVWLHSLRFGRADFGQQPAFLVQDRNNAGQDFDGLMNPVSLGISRVVIDVGRGKLAFGR